MNRWSEPTPAWERMLKGNVTASSYFWMAALFSLSALWGLLKAATLLQGNRTMVMLWIPSLVGALAIMALAAWGAVRAIRKARPLATERNSTGSDAAKLAFQKFRTYFYCAALVSLASWTLVAFIN
jgi:hypothetical protein